MTLEELDRWEASFRDFHARFAPVFARSESREQARKYLRGRLAPVERKNGWQMAQAVGDPRPDAMERLLYRAPWDADAARDLLEQFITETFGDPEATLVVDETGFLKKGDKSAGVARQYTGTAGKVEGAQVGVFLSYAAPRGHVLLDRRLFVPEAWASDEARRTAAKVPGAVVFETKPQQALAMLKHAWAQGVPMRWVTGDELYGDSPDFRSGVEASGHAYVLAVASTTPVWTRRPRVELPEPQPMGRPRKKARLAAGAPAWKTLAAVVNKWPAARWELFAVAEGEKGPQVYGLGALACDGTAGWAAGARGLAAGAPCGRRAAGDRLLFMPGAARSAAAATGRGRLDPLHDRAMLRGGQGRGRAGPV
jgi:SRSO17 transposase